jgi:hypothetical protein
VRAMHEAANGARRQKKAARTFYPRRGGLSRGLRWQRMRQANGLYIARRGDELIDATARTSPARILIRAALPFALLDNGEFIAISPCLDGCATDTGQLRRLPAGGEATFAGQNVYLSPRCFAHSGRSATVAQLMNAQRHALNRTSVGLKP